MQVMRKITVEVPEADLALAQELCGGSVTQAVRQGHARLAMERRRDILIALRGKVRFSDDWRILRGKNDDA
jgi:hypothetical protein